MSVYDARLLPRLTGTTVTTYDDPSPDVSPILPRRIPRPPSTHSASVDRSPSPAPTTHSAYTDPSAATEDTWTWVITKKLSEEVAPMTKSDVEEGSGVPHTVGKFECHLQGQPNRQAFMQIYWQIPIVGTEDDDARTVAQQAVPPPVCGELESFRLLKGCSAVPRFYGHAEKTQGERDLVPGGYIQYVVWEKVPGFPLTKEFFWGLDFSTRHEIREKFRAAFQQILSRGTRPGWTSISKIIYDQSTGSLHISGFRRVWPIPSAVEWSPIQYVNYGLAKPHREKNWWSHPDKWEW